METVCICCGAEIKRDWHYTAPIAESMCLSCAVEVDASAPADRLEEVELLEFFEQSA